MKNNTDSQRDKKTCCKAKYDKAAYFIKCVYWFVRSKICNFCCGHAYDPKRQAPQDSSNERMANATVIMAAFTMAIFIVGVRQYNIFSGQLDEMRNEQRPWLKVEPAMDNPIRFHDGYGSIPRNFIIKNVGHSPALNVRFEMWVLDNPHDDIVREQKRKCDAIKSTPLDNTANGIVVFPGDSAKGSEIGTGGLGELYAVYSPQAIQSSKDNSGKVAIWIYGCADYTFGDKTVHHQTGFIYQFAHIVRKKRMIDTMDLGFDPKITVPKEDLIIFSTPTASIID